MIALYLTFRFEWRMALAAIIAVVHDIIITVGVYAITGFEVTPATVVAFLTILGFSLYDTVVVFDKVKENEARLGTVRGDTYSHDGEPLAEPGADAVAQHLVRRAAAGGVAALRRHATSSAASTLRDFALALFVGLLIGAYSSIFVATPILAVAEGARAALPRAARACREPTSRRARSEPRRPARAPRGRRRRHRRPTSPVDAGDATPSHDADDASTRRRRRSGRRRRRRAARPRPPARAAGTPPTAGTANPRGRASSAAGSAAEPTADRVRRARGRR